RVLGYLVHTRRARGRGPPAASEHDRFHPRHRWLSRAAPRNLREAFRRRELPRPLPIIAGRPADPAANAPGLRPELHLPLPVDLAVRSKSHALHKEGRTWMVAAG